MSEAEGDLGQICIQVHLSRAPELDVARLTKACKAIAKRTDGVRGIGVSEGEDDGKCLNIIFAAGRPMDAWQALRREVLESNEFRDHLKAACMCMCTGSDGWNDYLLLYHFDPKIALHAGVGGP